MLQRLDDSLFSFWTCSLLGNGGRGPANAWCERAAGLSRAVVGFVREPKAQWRSAEPLTPKRFIQEFTDGCFAVPPDASSTGHYSELEQDSFEMKSPNPKATSPKTSSPYGKSFEDSFEDDYSGLSSDEN